MEAGTAAEIARIALCIPAWQIGIYIGINSVFMLVGERKLCLVTTYLFTFYWGFYVYGTRLVKKVPDARLRRSSAERRATDRRAEAYMEVRWSEAVQRNATDGPFSTV